MRSWRAKESSEEVRRIVADIRKEITAVTEEAQAGIQEVEVGNVVVQRARQSFASIENNSQVLSEAIGKVASAVRMMTQKGDDIVKNFLTIDEIARKNSEDSQTSAVSMEEQRALMEELAASADTLKEIAQILEDKAKQFRLT
ncbi:hypothetical protein [Heliorestis convoluta]|uniref:Methyl-accepting chemotaxis protein n=1 Tax=Heliorestis convoluta TaxID=356322 RepID=A0A5Q2N2C8_9FIRM|nr:hypothetical protein [Heliorestis convoluta]QGG47999.1 methyl-accepting chemotaxis protein [Heliorestis convoluta]